MFIKNTWEEWFRYNLTFFFDFFIVVVADGPNDKYVNGLIPRFQGECDLFVGLASVPGHVAFRHKKSGEYLYIVF